MEVEMIWAYQSTLGRFLIKQTSANRYELWLGEELLGNYPSPAAAADDVFLCATGHYQWDAQGAVNAPTDLSEWTRYQRR
jgi:hypothetical protein